MSSHNPRNRKLPFGSDKCLCGVCGKYFNSARAFDRHRIGSYGVGHRRCLTAEELRQRGFSLNATGHWITVTREQGDEISTRPLYPYRVAA